MQSAQAVVGFEDSRDQLSAYRAYVIGDDHRIATFSVILAGSDSEAVDQASLLVDGHSVELWDRTRLVAKFSPEALEVGDV